VPPDLNLTRDDLTKKDWLIPATFPLMFPYPCLLWEFARESVAITKLAVRLKETWSTISDGRRGHNDLPTLIQDARDSAYIYPRHLYLDHTQEMHEWHEGAFEVIQQLDIIMPTTDWRFALSSDFPERPFWQKGRTGAKPELKSEPSLEDATGLSKREGVSSSQIAWLRQRHSPVVSLLYAGDFTWSGDELLGDRPAPRDWENPLTPNDTEVPAVIVAVQLPQCGGGRVEEAVRAITKFARDFLNHGIQNPAEVDGFAIVALKEVVCPGAAGIDLSTPSRQLLEKWWGVSGKSEPARHRAIVTAESMFTNVVPESAFAHLVPSFIEKAERFWRDFLVGATNAAQYAGWTYNAGTRGDVWDWSERDCRLALKRLCALRASKHLSFAALEKGRAAFADELEKASKSWPVQQGDFFIDRMAAERGCRPFFNKKSVFTEAARMAIDEFHAIFPALPDEQPRTAALKTVREVGVRTRW